MARIRSWGRFFFAAEEKFFIRGVTYGPFPDNRNAEPLPEPEQAAHDFELMLETGINTVRVYDVPPHWFVDLANRMGIYLMAGIPWPQHLCFLDQYEVTEAIKKAVRKAVRLHRGNPTILAWFVGNEIKSHIVRWHSIAKIERFLEELCGIIREEDPEVMVTYANYPSTEYLNLSFLDFLSFNLYLHDEKSFSAYLKRLQNKAGKLPLVLSELGMDSLRQGEDIQAEFLAWQLLRAFELGVSGTVVFAWTDEWFMGGKLINDWAFGIVRPDRTKKLAYKAVADAFTRPLPPLPETIPFISVVVCAYNAESTINGCLSSFAHLSYPKFELIVVDDGSTDATGRIADEYAARCPYIKVIHQINLGLSAARNAGLYASSGSGGDIVAYTDADCYVDCHWLHYMALTMADGLFVAVGGPNLPPPEDNLTAACVAVSPGAPAHVLVTDEIAEHIPGCNMAFRKDRLLEIGGFDPLYRVAGDDVDICWRLQDSGYSIGFCAAMCVWHHRRTTISAYFKQQMGYGRAEGLLMPRHALRFNLLGNSRWIGQIYGDISTFLPARRSIIYHGAFGLGLFQTVYSPGHSLLVYLPLTMEWMVLSLILIFMAIWAYPFGVIGLVMIVTTLIITLQGAGKATLPAYHDTARARLIIATLILCQPVLRSLTRYRTRWSFHRRSVPPLAATPRIEGGIRSKVTMPRIEQLFQKDDFCEALFKRLTMHRCFWNHEGLERETALARIMESLCLKGLSYTMDSGFATNLNLKPWDIKVAPDCGMQCHLRLTIEDHGGGKRFVRLAGTIFPTGLTLAGFLMTGAGALTGIPVSTAAASILACTASVLALRAVVGAFRAASTIDILTQSLHPWTHSRDF